MGRLALVVLEPIGQKPSEQAEAVLMGRKTAWNGNVTDFYYQLWCALEKIDDQTDVATVMKQVVDFIDKLLSETLSGDTSMRIGAVTSAVLGYLSSFCSIELQPDQLCSNECMGRKRNMTVQNTSYYL